MKSHKYVIRGTLSGTSYTGEDNTYVSCKELASYADDVKKLMKDNEDDLAKYINKEHPLFKIVTSIIVDVEIVNDCLVSRTTVLTAEELTEEQKTALLEYVTGQFSDGFGEGLEQQEISQGTETITNYQTDDEGNEEEVEYEVDCALCVHLWQHMGGFNLEFLDLGDAANENPLPIKSKKKPRCKLIGEDGNIFNLIGLASRTLKDKGMLEEAKAMATKAMSAESYGEALVVIGEYVDIY